MSITIHISSTLRAYSNSVAELSLPSGDARTVREVLQTFQRDHTAVYKAICHENGNVRQHVNLFVNSIMVDKVNGLDTSLGEGDVVSIMHAVSGG